MRRASIRAIASHYPRRRLSNEELSHEFGNGWTPSKILEKTGIAERAIAAPGECASDLGVRAAEQLFQTGACRPADVDFLVFCTQSPDYYLPASSCLIQAKLELDLSCGAIDLNQGCSGFVYGLAVAKGLIESGSATNVLLVTSDTYSKYLHRTDWSTRAIFGDAAAATLLTAVESETELIGPFVFGTDGRGAEHLIVPAGGSRRPASVETAVERMTDTGGLRSDQNLRMNGPEMFRFTLQRVPSMVQELLRRADLQLEDVDRFVFHQANGYMLEHLRSKLGIPTEKFCLSLSHCGNTVSSSIPLALADERERGVGRGGETVMTVGFGVGLSWAGTLLRFE